LFTQVICTNRFELIVESNSNEIDITLFSWTIW